MKQTKIDWCDCTINPVVGCKNGCKFCYAEKMNKRFHYVEDWTEPEFFPERLEQLKSKKPKIVFMDSMSDVGWWELSWIRKTAKVIKNNPQHKYIFLSKRPDLFIEKCKSIVEDANKNNVWVGTTITTRAELDRLGYLPIYAHRFVSIEPIMEDFGELIKDWGHGYVAGTTKLTGVISHPEVVIIGAETGNRKGKVVPKKEWIDNIVGAIENFNNNKNINMPKIKIFMKESLRDIMGEDFRQDELLWGNL